MKTKLFAIFVASLMGLGTLTATAEKYPSKGCPPGGPVTIVKGVMYTGYDGTWETATFGLVGPRWARINYIEVTDLDNKTIGTIKYITYLGGYGINWYAVQLGKYNLKGQFLMKFHVSTRGGGVSTPIYIKAADDGSGDPTDPEETVIVIKWP